MLALIALQKPPYVVFDEFVKRSGQAILGVGRGTWEVTGADGMSKQTVFVQGNASKQVFEREGKPWIETVLASAFATYVDHDAKTYRQVTFTEYQGKWEAPRLGRMEEEGVELRLDPQRGLVLRTDPPVGAARVVTRGDEETLVAGFRKKNGVRWSVELVRDAKEKLPRSLSLTEGEGKLRKDLFKFERREIYPFELTIEPEAYKGYRKVPF